MTPTAHPRFVVFEGGDGVGKTTQVRLLAALLQAQGHDVLTTRQPGDSRIGAKIRRILLDPDNDEMDRRAETMLYAADRAQHVAETIRPALDAGRVVVCDRYIDSSVAYQGGGRGLAVEEVLGLSLWASRGLLPGLTVLLDADPEMSAARQLRRDGTADRLESAGLAFFRAARERFLALAAAEPERYVVVDVEQDLDRVHQQVAYAVCSRLPAGASL